MFILYLKNYIYVSFVRRSVSVRGRWAGVGTGLATLWMHKNIYVNHHGIVIFTENYGCDQ